MTRLDKKHTYQEEDISASSGLFGLMDSVMLKTYRITNEELDKICEIGTRFPVKAVPNFCPFLGCILVIRRCGPG